MLQKFLTFVYDTRFLANNFYYKVDVKRIAFWGAGKGAIDGMLHMIIIFEKLSKHLVKY